MRGPLKYNGLEEEMSNEIDFNCFPTDHQGHEFFGAAAEEE